MRGNVRNGKRPLQNDKKACVKKSLLFNISQTATLTCLSLIQHSIRKNKILSMSPSKTSKHSSCCVSMSGFAVECGWAVGEAIMIPHLLGLHLSTSVAGLIYLVNPIFSVFLATYVGRWSDRCTRCNRRQPFIIFFGIFAVLGFSALLLSTYLKNLTVQIFVVYFAFGIADLCHDLMLIPGRALLIDMLIEYEAREGLAATDGLSISSELQADAMYNEMQLWGRLFGLAVVSFPFEDLLSTTLKWSHFQISLGFSIIVLVVCTVAVLGTSRDRPYDPLLSPALKAAMSSEEHLNAPFLLNRHIDEEEANHIDEEKANPIDMISLSVVLFITFVFWVGSATFCFWGTSWLGKNFYLVVFAGI